MPYLEQAFLAKLAASAGVVAIIANRIDPVVLGEKTQLPALVYQRISGPREHSHDGPSGLASPRYQFSCYGRTVEEAKNLARQIRFALDGIKQTIEGVKIQGAFVENDIDDYDPETGRYRQIVDVVFQNQEDVA